MEKGRKGSLNHKILAFLILCWIVPIAVFFAFTTVSYREGIVEKTENLMEGELKNVAAYASIRIGDAITLSQRPSYERTWEIAWKNYEPVASEQAFEPPYGAEFFGNLEPCAY